MLILVIALPAFAASATIAFIVLALLKRCDHRWAHLAVASAALLGVFLSSSLFLWDRFLDIPKLVLGNTPCVEIRPYQDDSLLQCSIAVGNNGFAEARDCTVEAVVTRLDGSEKSEFLGSFQLCWSRGGREKGQVTENIRPGWDRAQIWFFASTNSATIDKASRVWLWTPFVQSRCSESKMSDALNDDLSEGIRLGIYEVTFYIYSAVGSYAKGTY